jgi:ribonuclease VapC
MVIDTSALIAILLNETEGKEFADAIGADQRRLLSSASLLEAGIVIEARKGPAGGRELDLLLHRARIEVVPLTVTQVEIAREA